MKYHGMYGLSISIRGIVLYQHNWLKMHVKYVQVDIKESQVILQKWSGHVPGKNTGAKSDSLPNPVESLPWNTKKYMFQCIENIAIFTIGFDKITR